MSKERKSRKAAVRESYRICAMINSTAKTSVELALLPFLDCLDKSSIKAIKDIPVSPFVAAFNIGSSFKTLTQKDDVTTHFDLDDKIVTEKDTTDKILAAGSLASGVAHLAAIGLYAGKKKFKKANLAILFGTDILNNSFYLIRNIRESNKENDAYPELMRTIVDDEE